MDSFEFASRRRLLFADSSGDDVCNDVALAANRCAGDASQDGELTDMRQSVGNGSLKELFGRDSHRRFFRKQRVQPLESLEESIDIVGPRARRDRCPVLVTADLATGPVEQIADVGEDLQELSPIEVTLPANGNAGESVPVTLEIVVTETGLLQLWCVARDGRRSWARSG